MSVFRRQIKYRLNDGRVVSRREKTFSVRFQIGGETFRRSGFIDRKSAEHFELTTRLNREKTSVGRDDQYARHRSRLLIEQPPDPAAGRKAEPGLIDEFISHLRTLELARMYAYNCERRMIRLAEEAGWLTLGDLSAESFESWRGAARKWRGKSLKPKTINQFLETANRFCAWAIMKGLLADNPLRLVPKARALDNPRYRRAATEEELQRLFAAADPDRLLFYRFVLYTPLRRDALEHLTWDHLRLDDPAPWVDLSPEISKSRRREKSAIEETVAADLRKLRETLRPESTDRVFPRVPTVDQLRADLVKAGVPFSDASGLRRLDLHAFRKTLVMMMKRSNVPLEQARRQLHHKDIRTTQKSYDDDQVDAPLSEAIGQLPKLGQKTSAETGAVSAQ